MMIYENVEKLESEIKKLYREYSTMVSLNIQYINNDFKFEINKEIYETAKIISYRNNSDKPEINTMVEGYCIPLALINLSEGNMIDVIKTAKIQGTISASAYTASPGR